MISGCCTLGQRDDIVAITRAMLPVDQGGEGLTVRAAAERYGVTKFAVETHRDCIRKMGYELATRTERKPTSERRPAIRTREPDSGQKKPDKPPDKISRKPDGSAREPKQAENAPDSEDRTSAGQAPDKLADKATETSATGDIDPAVLESWHDRVLYVADMIVKARWRGLTSVQWLCRIWSCSRDTVHEYHRSAALLCEDDWGTRKAQLHLCVAACQVIRDEARQAGDFRAAASFQSEIDKMLGLHPSAAVNVNVNHPIYEQVFGIVARVLASEDEHGIQRYPGALQAVEAAVQGYLAARRGESRLMDRPVLAAAG